MVLIAMRQEVKRIDNSVVVHACICYFPIGILGQVWYLIVSIPDLCTLTYFETIRGSLMTPKWQAETS